MLLLFLITRTKGPAQMPQPYMQVGEAERTGTFSTVQLPYTPSARMLQC